MKKINFNVDKYQDYTYNNDVNGTLCGRKLMIRREFFSLLNCLNYLKIFSYQISFLTHAF